MSFKAIVFLLIYCLNDLSIDVSGLLKSPPIIVLLLISLICMLIFLYIFEKVKVAQSCPNSLLPHGLYSPWSSPGQNTGRGSYSLLQRISPTQELSLSLLHYRQILYHLSYREVLSMQSTSGEMLGWVTHKLESRLQGDISTTSDMQKIPL